MPKITNRVARFTPLLYFSVLQFTRVSNAATEIQHNYNNKNPTTYTHNHLESKGLIRYKSLCPQYTTKV